MKSKLPVVGAVNRAFTDAIVIDAIRSSLETLDLRLRMLERRAFAEPTEPAPAKPVGDEIDALLNRIFAAAEHAPISIADRISKSGECLLCPAPDGTRPRWSAIPGEDAAGVVVPGWIAFVLCRPHRQLFAEWIRDERHARDERQPLEWITPTPDPLKGNLR